MSLDRALAQCGITADNIRQAEEDGVWIGSSEGAALLQLKPDANLDLELLIWLIVSVAPHGAYERNLSLMKKIGLELGAKRPVFYTKRRGWSRKATEWTRDGDRYALELTP